MLLEINNHSGVPIYRQVIEQIKHQIMAGQLLEAQQLTSVRDLAAQLRVNPMTISKAYAMLEADGLLERRRGIGLFVARVQNTHKMQTQTRILEGILNQAAITAAQFGFTEKQAMEMFEGLYKKYNSKTRDRSNE
ncbi:MAG TPA: GntR family transcriptional regulator [Sedimentisphaerales bacterium]|nr:GntR family transcriptional regulator [Sedimentisphaerales bacterium]